MFPPEACRGASPLPPAVLLHSLRPLPTLPLLEEAPVFTAVIFMNSYMYCKLHVPQRSPPRPLKPPSKLPVNIMASIQNSHKMQQSFLYLLVPLLCCKFFKGGTKFYKNFMLNKSNRCPIECSNKWTPTSQRTEAKARWTWLGWSWSFKSKTT